MNGKLPMLPRGAMRYLTVGIEFIAIFAVFVFVGVALDLRLGTKPVFILVGMVVGFAGSMYRVLRIAQELDWGRKGPPDMEDDKTDDA